MKRSPATPPVRVSVAQAKSQLSRLLREVDHQPVLIHNRGHDVAQLVPVNTAQPVAGQTTPFEDFFVRLDLLRKRLKVKGVEFEPEPAALRPVDPFADDE
jgi:antitoxin (DNA-binding transcriptional repressor) of toxin-antitoxin stability system